MLSRETFPAPISILCRVRCGVEEYDVNRCTQLELEIGIQTIAHPGQLPIFGWTALRPQSPSHLKSSADLL